MHGAGEGTYVQQGPTGLAGVRLGRYELVRLIGAGSAGAVYEGVHVGLSRRVAVKIIDPHLAERPETRARLFEKAQLLSQLGHPHVVELIDLGTEDGLVFLVMEHLQGEPLADYVRRLGTLSAAETVEIVAPAIAAVAAIHAAGTTHGSLSARNLFITRAPDAGVWPKLTDFAIATGPAVGDQHALGAMISQCVAGRSDLPAGFNRMIDRSMSVRVDERFSSVTDLGRELLSFASAEVRARWTRTFGDVPAAPQPVARPAAEVRSPVPVTAYTPGHQADLRSITIAIQPVSASGQRPWTAGSVVTVGGAGDQPIRAHDAGPGLEPAADAWAERRDPGSHRTPSPFGPVPPPPTDPVVAPAKTAAVGPAAVGPASMAEAPAAALPSAPAPAAALRVDSAASRTIAARPSALASAPPPPDATSSAHIEAAQPTEASRAARAAILQDPDQQDPDQGFADLDSDPAEFSYSGAVGIPRSRRTWLLLGGAAMATALVAYVALRSPTKREPATAAPAPRPAPGTVEAPPAVATPPAAATTPEAPRAPAPAFVPGPARERAAGASDDFSRPAERAVARPAPPPARDESNDAASEAPRAKARFGRNRAPLID